MIRVLLFIAFIIVPIVELAIIMQVDNLIGLGPTVLLLIVDSLIGAWLVRREGVRAWQRFRDTLSSGRMPGDEVLEGALVLFGGALLLTPGFATDALGLALMIPPTRALIAGVIKRQLGNRVTATVLGGPGARPRTGAGAPRGHGSASDVQVVDVQPNADGDTDADGRRTG